jgi:UDPglucose 6-dehydrogenase
MPEDRVDEVTTALALADRRLISDAYLTAGMGDGGGCHPRDNIALSWLARKLDLSFDLFEAAMLQREAHADWLVDLVEAEAQNRRLPIGILGTAYKPRSAIETGSPALLVAELLRQRGVTTYRFDPYARPDTPLAGSPYVWLVGCRHPEFTGLELARGSVVIDPWRYIPDREGVEVIRIGQRAFPHHGPRGASRAVSSAAA